MIPKVNLGVGEWNLCFVINTFLKSNFSPGDIDSTNLPCMTSVLPNDTSDSGNSSIT